MPGDEPIPINTFWMVSLDILIVTCVTGFLAPRLGENGPMAVAAFIVLLVVPGWAEAYIEYRKRLFVGRTKPLDQVGAFLMGVIHLVPVALVGGTAAMVFTVCFGAYLESQRPFLRRLNVFEVSVAFGIAAGIIVYLNGAFVMLLWRAINLRWDILASSNPKD